MNIAFGFTVKSFYKLYATNVKTGVTRELTDWFGNILLTNGRNELAKRDWFTACQVGTDSTLPNRNQTALLGYVAGSSSIEEVTQGAQSTAPYYGWKRKRFRFLNGSGIGNENLNEVGIGWSTATGDFLVTRALITNLLGEQTTVTPLPDEILDIVVEIRYYPPLNDVTGTVTLNGTVYDWIIRAASVTSTTAWANNIGKQIFALTTVNWTGYDNDIGSITTGPNGVPVPADTFNNYTAGYQENSYQIAMGNICGPGTLNVDGWYITTGKLLRSILIATSAGYYQLQFDSQSNPGFGVPKTNNETMRVQVLLGWEEAAPVFSGTVVTQNWTSGVPVSVDIAAYFQANIPEPIVYSLESGSIPSGVNLNAATGLLSGTPDTVSSGTMQITCTNDVGSDSTNIFNWSVV